MVSASEGFEISYKRIHKVFQSRDHPVLNKSLKHLTYDDVSELIMILGEEAEKHDYRPFWAMCNRQFSMMAQMAGKQTWEAEKDSDLTIKESPTAAVLCCFYLGNLQSNVLHEPSFANIHKAIHAGGKAWQLQQPVKNANICYRQVTGMNMEGKKPSGCLVLMAGIGLGLSGIAGAVVSICL